MQKVFLIDGHAQIFRMYYAFMRRPMINSKGQDTSILYGFTKMILELIAKEHPTHIAVAFDPKAKTFRHEAFPEYKANRSAAPELVKAALEPLQEILGALNIPVVMMPGFEADDVIGSMATQWDTGDNRIFMVTPDKDYGQLITENVFQYKPAKGANDIEVIGPKEVCEHYGICEPEKVVDYLTILGDTADNVPGIRGIGQVGARKLMEKYGSLDEIIRHADELPKKQKESVESSLEQIEMSRFLVTIKKDIDLPVTLEDIRLHHINAPELGQIFEKFEFNSLRKLLPAEMADGSAAAAATGTDGVSQKEEKRRYEITAPERLSPEAFSRLAMETGTAALEPLGNGCIAAAAGKAYTVIPADALAQTAFLQDARTDKTGYGFKQLYKLIWSHGGTLEGKILDIELMHYILNPERSHKEGMLLKSYMDIEPEAIDAFAQSFTGSAPAQEVPQAGAEPDLFSSGSASSCADPAAEKTAQLAAGIRCSLLLRLRELVLADLQAAGMVSLYDDIEAPLVKVLADMEYTGVKIDTAHLKNYSRELGAELAQIEAQAKECAQDDSINLSSPKQVGILLYEKLRLNPKVKKSAKGSYHTDEETLNEMLDLHPIVGQILEYRGIRKLISTYTDALPEMINPKTGKIHTTFNQSLTATGRLSSTNPNLQNIPIRTERGREIRKAFIPSDPAGCIISADYSQIELRLMAHMSGDPHLIEAFNRNMDIHTATAAKVFKVTEAEVTKEQRSRAKVANFGIIYGISAFGLSQRLGMTRSDSKALIEEYFNSYPKVKEYMNNMIAMAKEKGYVETIYGRKRYLPDINSRNAVVRNFSERNAINAPLQGSAADIIKVAMINVYNRIAREHLKSKMVLQVHDELIFDVVPGEEDAVSRIVTEEMAQVIRLSIPLIAECGRGENWLQAH